MRIYDKQGFNSIMTYSMETPRSKCLRNLGAESRQVHVFNGQRRPGSITDEMKKKIDTPEGRHTYSKRLGIVEPVFGNIRECKWMDQVHLAR